MEHFKPLWELLKVSIEKEGLVKSVLAFLILLTVPILAWRLPEIITAIKA